MRYYTDRPENCENNEKYYYRCDHPLYSVCTLYKSGDRGLGIVQMRFNPRLKIIWYGPIETWLGEEIFYNTGFKTYFDEHAGQSRNGLYPTVTVRQIMWALKMKPLRKEWWESQDLQSL